MNKYVTAKTMPLACVLRNIKNLERVREQCPVA